MDKNDIKEQANQYFTDGKYEEAIKLYTQILESNVNDNDNDNYDNNNHIILSNRSATYVNMKEYNKALADGVACTKLKPEWSKAWCRVGAALYGLDKLDEALVAYNKAYELEPLDTYKKMIDEIKVSLTKIKNELFNDDMPKELNNNPNLENMFGSMFETVISNPSIMEKLIDPDFQNKILSLQNNPIAALNDQDIMKVMNEMMKNINLS